MLIQAEIPALIILTIKYKFSLEPNVYNNKALGNFQTENRKGDKLRAKNIASSIGSDAFFFARCRSRRTFLHIYVFGKEPKQLNYVLSLIKLYRKRAMVNISFYQT